MNTAVAPIRPTRQQMVPLKDCRTIGEALQSAEMVERLKQAVPRHLSPERMLRVLALAVNKTPKLQEANMMGLLAAMLGLASLGLEPNTPLGHAFLIPFNNRRAQRVDVQVVIGYPGLIDLARRSGELKAIHADVVYQGDEFEFMYGTEQYLRHRPAAHRSDKPLYAYAVAHLRDGGVAFEVMAWSEVMAIRNGSQGYLRDKENSPWAKHEAEMAKKTAVRRLIKWLPRSVEMANAAELEDRTQMGAIAFDPIAGSIEDLGVVEQADDGAAAETQQQAAAQIEQKQEQQAGKVETKAQAEPEKAEAAKETPPAHEQQVAAGPEWVYHPIKGKPTTYPTWQGFHNAILTGIGNCSGDALDKLMDANGEAIRRLDHVSPEHYQQVLDEAGRKGWTG
jgi:recombination protein RecT